MKVCKFGGTSLATAAQVKKVSDIISSDPTRRIVVVSAPGKRYKEDIKVTDLLISCAEKYLANKPYQEIFSEVLSRYEEMVRGLELSGEILDDIRTDLTKRLYSDSLDRTQYMELLKASGEDHCAKLVAAYLRTKGVEAHYIDPKEAGLLLTKENGKAQVLPESYLRLRVLQEKSGILIFPGFFGYTPEGTVVTFSRGGSDITGSILAAAVQADLYENFTDVDSVFVVNPNIVNNPRGINKLTFKEMRELSYSGFEVFHDEALIPAFRAKVPICIKNTNNPAAPGTMIVSRREADSNLVAGIASDEGYCSIYLCKYLMHAEPDFGFKLRKILEEENLPLEYNLSGNDDISLLFREEDLSREKEARVTARMKAELAVDQLVVGRDLAVVMLVGPKMRNNLSVLSKASGVLSRQKINVELINQGCSEVGMMFGVKKNHMKKAVHALYQEFFGVYSTNKGKVASLSV
ncbi:aspartate kinase [Ammoniphilus sp. YIM 78166]|uniref:aspartate kinase n=1 Tax=Ammoniphilus sp. YIM 78166 TaxID=1644106 RepID=UPI00106F0EA0|nr:aspartate kinase [Ammoniphilus sp. YIM 78166]